MKDLRGKKDNYYYYNYFYKNKKKRFKNMIIYQLENNNIYSKTLILLSIRE